MEEKRERGRESSPVWRGDRLEFHRDWVEEIIGVEWIGDSLEKETKEEEIKLQGGAETLWSGSCRVLEPLLNVLFPSFWRCFLLFRVLPENEI